MIATAVETASEATWERSRPRPMTTTAMPRARMPRMEMLRASANRLPTVMNPFSATLNTKTRTTHIAKTAIVWLGLRKRHRAESADISLPCCEALSLARGRPRGTVDFSNVSPKCIEVSIFVSNIVGLSSFCARIRMLFAVLDTQSRTIQDRRALRPSRAAVRSRASSAPPHRQKPGAEKRDDQQDALYDILPVGRNAQDRQAVVDDADQHDADQGSDNMELSRAQ